jgi:uncharacterized SAM-binding protein YcdF (DUF218 family)
MSGYDAILIPGGGLKDQFTPPDWVKNRLDYAAQIQQGEILIPLSAGTTHKPPPLDQQGFPVFESVVSALYLRERGISPTKILIEACSYDTIGNAYFSRVLHTEPGGLRKLMIVTSEFHMPRTAAIFEWIYNLDRPATPYDLHFHSVPNVGIDDTTLQARIDKEREGLNGMSKLRENIPSLQALHSWLFTQHNAYSVAGHALRGTSEIGGALSTY